MTREETIKLLSNHQGKHYTYALCNPDTLLPFYIGCGSNLRVLYHEAAAKSVKQYDGNIAKRRIIQELWQKGKTVDYQIICFGDKEACLDKEMELIHLWYDDLCNKDFGDGSCLKGKSRSQEFRQHCREGHKRSREMRRCREIRDRIRAGLKRRMERQAKATEVTANTRFFGI